MERLMAWAMRNPRTVLVGALIVSVIAASQLPKLRIAISPQSLTIEGGPDQEFYEDTLATFGSDRITMVYIADPDLFKAEKLEVLGQVVKSIERLPFVEKTRSLFNVAEIRVKDESVTTDPFLRRLPADMVEADQSGQGIRCGRVNRTGDQFPSNRFPGSGAPGYFRREVSQQRQELVRRDV